MTRVILHAGFHKTGTTSLQLYLAEQSDRLKPWMDFHGQGAGLHRSAVAARVFAKKPFFWRKRAFRRAFRADLAALPDAATIVLSREHYSGVMPGILDWRARLIPRFLPAAKPLARIMISEVRRRFGPGVEVAFLYTTRHNATWLPSVYGHQLFSTPLIDSFDTFAARFPEDFGPEWEARQMQAYLDPVPVHISRLEDWASDRCGPAGAVLRLVGVPPEVLADLPPARPQNTGQDTEILEEFLSLNRQNLTPETLREKKFARKAER